MLEFLRLLFAPLAVSPDPARVKHELEEVKGSLFVAGFGRDKAMVRALKAQARKLEQELDNAVMGSHDGGTLILIA
jgi:hypothetical protein